MAADPTLADRLDDLANDRRWDCWSMHGERIQDHVPDDYEPSIDCCDAAEGFHSLRAAAVRLRKLDAIEPDELRAIGDRLRELDPYWREAEERKQLLYALADAMGGTE